MAHLPQPHIDEEELFVCKARKLNEVVITKCLQDVFMWGTHGKIPSVNVIEYLEGKRELEKSAANFKKKLKPKQKELITNNTVSVFDITLLFLCIQWACDDLAPVNDKRWHTYGDDLESLVYSAKEFRNELAHENMKLNKHLFTDRTGKIRNTMRKLLRAAGNFYHVSQFIIEQAIKNMDDQINYVRDSSFVPNNYSDYNKLLLFSELRRMVCNEGKQILQDLYKNYKYISPITKLMNFKFKIDKIYTKMILQNESRTTRIAIDYKDILEDINQNKSDPIILFEGLAGFGKTTLMKMILNDWVEERRVMHKLCTFSILLYVECRNSFIDTFQKLLSSSVQSLYVKFNKEDLHNIIIDLKTLVLIDGLDEINQGSMKLLCELLSLKKNFGLTLIATSRPERIKTFYSLVEDADMQVKHINLEGIPQEERQTFVTKYQENMDANGLTYKKFDLLLKYLERTSDHLDSVYKSPYNLTLLSVSWNEDPEKVNSFTTAPELYHYIHLLSTDKLIGRLQKREETQHVAVHDLREKVNGFVDCLCNEALLSQKHDEMNLLEESVTRLREYCIKNNLPVDEMLSSFLKEVVIKTESDSKRRMSFMHKMSQDFLASLALWHDIQRKSEDPNFEKLLEDLEKCNIPVNSATEIETTILKMQNEWLLSTSSQRQESVRELLQRKGDLSNLSKYEGILINLLGHFVTEDDMRYEETKTEILNMLHESGVDSVDRWLKVVSSVKLDKSMLDYILKVPGILDGIVEIRKSNAYAYAALFEHKQPQSVVLMVDGDHSKILRFRDLLKMIRIHNILVYELIVNDANADVITEELDFMNVASVNLIFKMNTTKLSKMKDLEQGLLTSDTRIKSLCLDYHYMNPTSTFQHETLLEHLSDRYLGDEYVGPVSEVTRLPLSLRKVRVSTANNESLQNLQRMVKNMEFLKSLDLCIHLHIAQEKLQVLEFWESRDESFVFLSDFNLVIPQVQDEKDIHDAATLIGKIIPNKGYLVLSFSFPSSSFTTSQVKMLISDLTGLPVLRNTRHYILLPVSANITEQERDDLSKINTQISIAWKEESVLWQPSKIMRNRDWQKSRRDMERNRDWQKFTEDLKTKYKVHLRPKLRLSSYRQKQEERHRRWQRKWTCLRALRELPFWGGSENFERFDREESHRRTESLDSDSSESSDNDSSEG